MRRSEAAATSRSVSRRNFLRTAAVTSGTVGAGFAAQAWAQSSQPAPSASPLAEPELPPLPFVHGVASGDPLPDSVVLWTRVTPDDAAWPGSGGGAPTPVRWDVATDPEFLTIVQHGESLSHPDADHTVHIDVHGLAADSVYFYRFVVTDGPHAGATSPTGRTKTAPAPGAPVKRQRWAVASCANYEAGFFSAYADMAERGWAGDIDLTVFLGDYIYEYAQYGYSGFGPVRLHHPAHEIVSLADYRTRYGRYRTDQALKNAHAAMPWIVVWDDHEVANNNWRDGADNHDASEGDFYARRDAAIRAYYEWMPVRTTQTSTEGHIYRTFTFGDLVELTVMDLRTYRDVEFWRGGSRQPGDARTMLGSEQYNWLINTLERSKTKWNALGNSVMFSPMRLGTVMQNPATRPIAKALSSNILSSQADIPAIDELPLNGDQWDGYDSERRRLLDALGRLGKNPIFLTGDIHTEWSHTIPYGDTQIGCEVVCSSITAPNVTDSLGLPAGHPLMRTATGYMFAANPNLRHCALDTHGYTIVTIADADVFMEWLRVDDILAPLSPVRTAAMLNWRKGVGFTA
ncbi:Phospholipase D precursor [Corynebacterium glaucum]|uniref:alkaline phosphatase D family protein n=1 Tax=Corynebacterium glaucum TaxID=187491 RepID=UPI0025B4F869|nr:alkaline phosphatase D family protein [Corynebacterium glaucum]WJZ06641.1 Phospholipase D precursor [Corynebacterium glaucum]